MSYHRRLAGRRGADSQSISRSWVPLDVERRFLPISTWSSGIRKPVFRHVLDAMKLTYRHRSFAKREKDEKKTRGVKADSLMGRVLVALSRAGLLDTEKMFAEGTLQRYSTKSGCELIL